MALELYKKKRDFKKTAEPSGKLNKAKAALAFVIQRHKASHLHYDFRLEMDGVLKSWAVPKGPSLNPKDKRLAMMVEDHPYDYKDFAGVIPEGNYGAGIVEIWDEGTYSDISNSPLPVAQKNLKAALKKGDLKFQLFGKKLKGEFVLVKLKSIEENTWLLIKHKDRYATDLPYNSEEETPKNSPINKWLETGNQLEKKKKFVRPSIIKEKKLTNFIAPMLAKETATPFDDKDWLYEIKWDGYRAIAEKNKKDLLLYSRKGLSFLSSYPVVVQELLKIQHDVVIDGEIVVTDDEGNPSFQLLQNYSENQDKPIQYHAFDLLRLNGKDTTELTLLERKELLAKIIPASEVIKYSDHVEAQGKSFFEVSKEQKLEGIMAKKMDSQYYPGKRTNEWLKIKHHTTQEAIIAGFTPPAGSRKFFGALILAVKDGDKLRYLGNTGGGFSQQSLKEMYETMKPLIQKNSPFNEKVQVGSTATWLKPELVCEVKFAEITSDGKLRQSIFLHLRTDKDAAEVTKPVAAIAPKKSADKPAAKTASKKKGSKVVASATEEDKPDTKEFSFGRAKVTATHLNKIYFPTDGITKGDVIHYYHSMASYILPYLKGRPESLLRHPNGIHNQAFFHKDAACSVPAFIKHQKIFSDSTYKEIDYIICDNEATLTYMNNLGCIEINPWHSTIDKLDNPDYMIIDLDPSDENTFEQVVEAANVVKEILDMTGAPSFCKTSGASGLHIFVPCGKKYDYEHIKNFAFIICSLASEQLQDFTTTERNLKKRGKKHIYMDALQNRRGQTLACVYSLRPKDGGTVSTPLLWEEVKPGLSPKHFTLYNIAERVEKMGDLFKGVIGKGIDIAKCLKKLGV